MNIGLIPARYAAALLNFAQEKSLQDKVYDEVKMITHFFTSHKDLRTMLENPVLDKTQKRKIMITAAGIEVSSVLEKFVDLLLENNREMFLKEIALKYTELYRHGKEILHGRLITAVEVDKSTEKNLISLVEKNIRGTLELEKVIDPTIIGGFQLEVDSVRWDASIKNQLTKIRNEYIERNKRIV